MNIYNGVIVRYGLTIGRLAVQTGFSPKTIRYYEAVGLLPPPRRSPSGYRLYDPEVLSRLEFIRKAKAVGLRLAEIREVLELWQVGRTPCDYVLTLLDAKLATLDVQIRELRKLRRRLFILRRKSSEAARLGCICGIIESAGVSPSLGE